MKLLREGRSFSGRERNCAFLNRGDSRFANISAVSGFDFPDDGRAVASVDWDQDGDLDLWLQNRTGPRLRFLRNQIRESTPSASHDFVAIQLRGVLCNRDGIGARVEVRLEDPAAKPIIQTLCAGDGYLSQSSKSLHFGIPAGTRIKSVRVRWPGGVFEEFSSVKENRRNLLVQDAGVAEVLDPRPAVALAPQVPLTVDNGSSIRAVFANPVALPLLSMETRSADNASMLIETKDRPLLIVFWASWCPNCREELSQIARHAQQFEGAKLDVLALNVDSLSVNGNSDPEGAANLLRQIKFPFASGYATSAVMDKVQIMQRVVLNRPLPSAIPTLLLVNRRRELAAIYQGVHSIDTFLKDAESLDARPLARRDLTIPFAGTWTTTPDVVLLRPVAHIFREAGYREDYEHFLRIDRQQLSRLQQGGGESEAMRDLELRYANDSLDLGLSLLEAGQAASSIEYFRAGLACVPQSATGHFHLGRALLSLGQTNEAVSEFESALQIDPKSHAAQFQLGVVLAARERFDGAAESFRRVVEQQPNHLEAWTNLGVVLARLRQVDDAIAALRRATEIDPNREQPLLFLGGQLASRGEFLEASRCFLRVTEVNPSSPQGFAGLGQTLVKLHLDLQAANALARAVALNPQDAGSRLQLAWLQATSPHENVRNGENSLSIATALAEQTQERDPRVLDVLAAAYAENGQYEKAKSYIQKTLSQIPQDHPLQRVLRDRLQSYEDQRPYRDSPNSIGQPRPQTE